MLKKGDNDGMLMRNGTKSFARQNKQLHKNGVPGGRAAAKDTPPINRRRVFVFAASYV